MMRTFEQQLDFFENFAAARLRAERETISRTWLERISADAADPAASPPRDALLEALPLVLGHVAEFVMDGREEAFRELGPAAEAVAALAPLWHGRRQSAYLLFRELDELARVLDGACLAWLADCPGPPPGASVVRVAGRLNRAPILIGELCVSAVPGLGAVAPEPPFRELSHLHSYE